MTSPTKRRHIALSLAIVAVVAACVVPVPPNGWRSERGPVVPHDTFPADCSLCHITGNWHVLRDDFTFDHAAETGWPLVGAHSGAECLLCHNDRGPAGTFAQRGCGGCHEDPHQGHLGATCASCHAEQSWRPREAIAQHASTRFPLIGVHAVTACFACHPGAEVGNFQRVDTRCASCHRHDAAEVSSPDHMALGWTECEDCHRATSFADVRFAHPATFPLRGGHASVACRACHTSGRFTSLPTDCSACHLADYNRTTDPDHAASNFPTDCASCHRLAGWSRARFDHTTYPLQGGHKSAACSDCHTGGVYAGTPRDCVSCHRDDYTATSNPNHASAGFGTTCDDCHTGFSNWRGAEFSHTFFPIETGKHRQLDCNDCHQTPVYANFTCVSCHDHARAEMDDEHDDVNGYAYASTACLFCHPQGVADDDD